MSPFETSSENSNNSEQEKRSPVMQTVDDTKELFYFTI